MMFDVLFNLVSPKGQAKMTTNKLELIHLGFCGFMSEKSWRGSCYFITFIDDCSRKT